MQRNRIILAWSMFVLLAVGVTGLVWWSRRSATRAVSDAQLDAEAAGKVAVVSTAVAAPRMDGIEVLVHATGTRALVGFRGKLYAATGGGLLCFDEGGALVKHFTVTDGLPDLDLTALGVFQDRLYVGTRTAGLLAFDGMSFTHHVFKSPKAAHVTALCPTQSYLLIGTLDGGLFDFDGQTFSRRFQPTNGPKITAVTAVLAVESRLYVGSQANGLFVWRNGEMVNVTNGLPSQRVTALALQGASVLVATDAGMVRLTDAGQVEKVSGQPNITSLMVSDGKVWAGLVTGGIAEVGSVGTPGAGGRFSRGGDRDRPTNTVLTEALGSRWALTDGGIFQLVPRPGGEVEWKRWGNFPMQILTDGHVTSLAFDPPGRLWVGYFENGIDVLAPDGTGRERRVRDETVREINFLTYDGERSRMLAATSAGFVGFDTGFQPTVYDDRTANLIGRAVAHIYRMPPGSGEPPLVVATGKGLTVIQGGIARSLTAFHGLASNYLYCSESLGGKLYVGSLGGLMELDGLRVVRTWKTDNSRLSANWINALVAADGRLYVGTYGGGVDVLLPTGEITAFEETKGIEVNPNAMATDGERLYVGTLDRGLLLYDFNRKTWKSWKTALPATNVTAVVVREGTVYIGTTGGLAKIAVSRLAE